MRFDNGLIHGCKLIYYSCRLYFVIGLPHYVKRWCSLISTSIHFLLVNINIFPQTRGSFVFNLLMRIRQFRPVVLMMIALLRGDDKLPLLGSCISLSLFSGNIVLTNTCAKLFPSIPLLVISWCSYISEWLRLKVNVLFTMQRETRSLLSSRSIMELKGFESQTFPLHNTRRSLKESLHFPPSFSFNI